MLCSCPERDTTREQHPIRVSVIKQLYRGQIVQLVNQALNDKVTSVRGSTIARVLSLMTDEVSYRSRSWSLDICCSLTIPKLIKCRKFMNRNFKSYKLHADALRVLVTQRGGLDRLCIRGYLPDKILGYVKPSRVLIICS
jgi:hypothetical protein